MKGISASWRGYSLSDATFKTTVLRSGILKIAKIALNEVMYMTQRSYSMR